MGFKERLSNKVAKHIPTDEYLRIRAREDVSPEERVQLTDGALSIYIDLNSKLKFTISPTVILSRAVVRSIPLGSFLLSRTNVSERAISSNHRRYEFYETGFHQNSEEQDKAFFRGERLKKDFQITQSVAEASQIELPRP